MNKTLLAAPALVFLCACNYRIYLDGQFSYKTPEGKWWAQDYQAVVLDPNDPQPKSAKFIEKVAVVSPQNWLRSHSVDTLMTDQLKGEARAMGANLIRVTEKTFLNASQISFVANLYSYHGPDSARFLETIDSLHRRRGSFARVRIFNLASFTDTMGIYFRDSLFKKCYGLQGMYSYFEFTRSGRIYCTNNRVPRFGPKVKPGKEYFFVILFYRRQWILSGGD